jgi:hypothetical protein
MPRVSYARERADRSMAVVVVVVVVVVVEILA